MSDLAYKFETSKGTVVISGDTAYNPKLAEFAKGADLLVHEVIDEKGVDALVAQVPNADTLKKHLIDSHTAIPDVGRVAALAEVKTLVLTHFVAGDQNTDEQWSAGVREHFFNLSLQFYRRMDNAGLGLRAEAQTDEIRSAVLDLMRFEWQPPFGRRLNAAIGTAHMCSGNQEPPRHQRTSHIGVGVFL